MTADLRSRGGVDDVLMPKVTKRVVVVGLFVLGCASLAGAGQTPIALPETNADSVVPFLEPTEVLVTRGVRPENPNREKRALFEAAISPHLVAWQNYSRSLVVTNQANPRWLRRNFAVVATPGVTLRMFNETSKPVKTPSYWPRVQVQRMLFTSSHSRIIAALGAIEAADDTRRVDAVTKAATVLQERPLDQFELHGALFHYSNGQSGCLSADQRRPVKENGDLGECEPEHADGDLNYKDGSFAVQAVVRIGANFRRSWLSAVPRGAIAAEADRELTLRLDYDQHLAITAPIRNEYRPYRIRTAVEWAGRWPAFCRRQSRAALANVFNTPAGQWPSWSITASCFPVPNGGWGVFARYYQGRDYYNVYFRQDRQQLQVGIAFSHEALTRLYRVTPK